MLGHVSIRVSDLTSSVDFYLKALSPLGFKPMAFPEVVGIGPAEPSASAPIPCFWLRKHTPNPGNDHAEKPTPVHISFYASERSQVDEFHKLGLEAGGRDNGPPGVRPFFEGYYAAYILDLDGNNIEVVKFS
ncbi:VOC family protein [Aspergillus lucknowensis]|uniref:Glyoxalase/Bleomycin resistance protein/Dihydroxybiphenyl dioxygenase n=1 Tax=Aspergillus lucknowensis TaxID=176173 RepID=A0ABR4LSB9_9EURO